MQRDVFCLAIAQRMPIISPCKRAPFSIMSIHVDMSRHDDEPGLAEMNDAVLSFDAIRQDFPAPGASSPIRVIDGISFEVGSGKFVAVIGPSGCGKSTLLQMAAGLLIPTRGGVHHRGRKVTSINTEVGFVPQQAQLFPWKTLAENVELPLLLRGVAADERSKRVASALGSVGLKGFERHLPGQLSGGMQKRGS